MATTRSRAKAAHVQKRTPKMANNEMLRKRAKTLARKIEQLHKKTGASAFFGFACPSPQPNDKLVNEGFEGVVYGRLPVSVNSLKGLGDRGIVPKKRGRKPKGDGRSNRIASDEVETESVCEDVVQEPQEESTDDADIRRLISPLPPASCQTFNLNAEENPVSADEEPVSNQDGWPQEHSMWERSLALPTQECQERSEIYPNYMELETFGVIHAAYSNAGPPPLADTVSVTGRPETSVPAMDMNLLGSFSGPGICVVSAIDTELPTLAAPEEVGGDSENQTANMTYMGPGNDESLLFFEDSENWNLTFDNQAFDGMSNDMIDDRLQELFIPPAGDLTGEVSDQSVGQTRHDQGEHMESDCNDHLLVRDGQERGGGDSDQQRTTEDAAWKGNEKRERDNSGIKEKVAQAISKWQIERRRIEKEKKERKREWTESYRAAILGALAAMKPTITA